NHCARLRAIAHGGQVLVKGVTADLAREALSHELTLRDLGHHQLRDLEQPERVWQLLHPRLPSDFPPLKSLSARRDNWLITLRIQAWPCRSANQYWDSDCRSKRDMTYSQRRPVRLTQSRDPSVAEQRCAPGPTPARRVRPRWR